MLYAILIVQADPNARQHRQNACRVTQLYACAAYRQANGAVHRTGIHIDKAKAFRNSARNCTFSRAGRAVNGNRN